jgi:putative nucleotidyltransferase with HDIG domain
MAGILTLISFLDVLIAPIGKWQVDQTAPTTYRAPTVWDVESSEPLSFFRTKGNLDTRFIIKRGEKVKQEVLGSLRLFLPDRVRFDPKRAGGVWAFYFVALTFFSIALRRSKIHLCLRFRAVLALYVALVVSMIAARFLLDRTTLSPYAAPVSFAAVLLGAQLGQTLGLVLHLLAVVLIAQLDRFMPGMILLPLACGWSAVSMLKRESGPIRIVLASIVGALTGGLFMLGLDLFSPESFDLRLHFQSDFIGLLGGNIAAGIFAAIFSYPAIELFGNVPRLKLTRLMDLDHPLLIELSEKAPGTFQHVMAVANMAEKVSHDIGVDDQLVRVGVYYHDIGKMQQPEYFVENQQGDNPHDRLSPEASAEILRNHVRDGVTIARGAVLPRRIIDFIVEHHGTSTMDYFIDKAARSGAPFDPRAFEYDGRNPTSKETGILLIVDAIEAASRSLKSPDHNQVEELVRRIIFNKLLQGHLDNSGLTTKDLKQIGLTLVRYLEAHFHVRVEYPWQRQAEFNTPISTSPALRVAQPVVSPPVISQPVISTIPIAHSAAPLTPPPVNLTPVPLNKNPPTESPPNGFGFENPAPASRNSNSYFRGK